MMSTGWDNNEKPEDIRKQLDRITEELIDDIINTSNKDILKEVAKEYGDPAYLAKKARVILERAKRKVKDGE